MKKTVIAAATALTLTAGSGLAGGLDDPIVTPEVVIVEETTASSSSGAAFVTMSALIVFLAALSN